MLNIDPRITDAAYTTIGVALALAIITTAIAAAWLTYDWAANTRPAWWARARNARRRLRRRT